MRVHLMLFAILREQTGTSEIDLDLPTGATVAAASQQIGRRFPVLAGGLQRVAYAVNRSYVPASTVLREGDELAIIPPVSGG